MKRKFYSHSESPKQNHYIFEIAESRHITISSHFQSGNIRLIRQTNPFSYVLESVNDIEGFRGKKSWFYFKMKAWAGVKVKVSIQNVSIYQNCLSSKQDNQPLFKIGAVGEWQPLSSSSLSNDQTVSLAIEYKFTTIEEVFFCVTVPFTYTDNQLYLSQLQANVSPQINYKNELLSFTLENREVRLLSITQYGSGDLETEKNKKPVILITCRVHPGEVTSSFCLMGILQMLLGNSLQGYLLRRLFEWKIVPMVNPDGVACGNYRMDPQGCNLNRLYRDPNQILQPAVFEILSLIKQLSAPPRTIEFYFDLHSHSSIKDSFIYGNALDDLIQQAYAQLYCRILQENSSWFKSAFCQFGEKHMKFKDKGEEKTKEGCGRVMALKLGRAIRSYTLQVSMLPSYFYKIQKGHLKERKNKDFCCKMEGYATPLKLQDEQQYQNPLIGCSRQLGNDLLVSILDMVQKNPFSRINRDFMMTYLRQTAQKLLQKQDRFKLFDCHSYSKIKIATKIVEEDIEKKLEDSWSRSGIGQQLNSISWPCEVRKIKQYEPPKSKFKVRLQSLRTEPDEKGLKGKEKKRILKTEINSKNSQSPYLDQSLNLQVSKLLHHKSQISQDETNIIKFSLKEAERGDFRRDQSLGKVFERIPNQLFQNSFKYNKIIEFQENKNLLNKYVIHNMTPSMCLLNSAKFIARQRTQRRKLEINNCYKASISNQKRALTDLKLPLDSLNDCALSQGKISLEFGTEGSRFQSRRKQLRSRLGKSIDGKEVKEQIEKESIRLPSMKRNRLFLCKERAYSRVLC